MIFRRYVLSDGTTAVGAGDAAVAGLVARKSAVGTVMLRSSRG
jgi:hypothetical protein